MDFSPRNMFTVAAAPITTPMPLNREQRNHRHNRLRIDDGGGHLWCDGEGGGSANLKPSGELSRKILFLIKFSITGQCASFLLLAMVRMTEKSRLAAPPYMSLFSSASVLS